MEQVRSFIAIELPDELKLELSQLVAKLKSGEQSWVKWVDPYNIHLTLKFLGNVAVDMLDDITGALEKAAQGRAPFHLEVKELGVFPNLRRVQVAWVGISGEVDKLAQLQQHIESNLAPLGFAPESRPFVPHLTLARLRDQALLAERQRFGQLITGTKFLPLGQ
jgi:2'-5' RNA ligase